jgi:hypothetical protein
VKRFLFTFLVGSVLALGLTASGSAQDIIPTPYFTSFADTMIASTFDGQPLVIGSVIDAYDPSGVHCGTDTARFDIGSGQAIFGYFPVYGDDAGTGGVDEGAVDGETISFKINGRDATVTDGSDTWTNQALKSVTLAATSTSIAITAISLPTDTLILPGDTVTLAAQVRNDGDGLDFYGVKLSMTATSGTPPYDWEALEPDSVIYADAGETVTVLFSVRVPTLNADTANMVSFTIYSHLDTAVTVTGDVNLFMTVTDVEDDFGGSLPGNFALYQNYPNPFNPTTTIAYNLAIGSSVRLEIIDLLGRTVDNRDLGKIEFDAAGLASGVYFYRFVTDTGSQSRKMVLLK